MKKIFFVLCLLLSLYLCTGCGKNEQVVDNTVYVKTQTIDYGASSNEHRNLMPNYLLQWEMIKMAIARHDDIYDFRGVVGNVEKTHPQYGLYRFKQGFGADLIEWIGEIYMPFKPITYKLYRFSEKAFRTIRQIKRKIAK